MKDKWGVKENMKAVWGRIWKDIRKYKIAILIFAVYYVVEHMVFRAFCPLVLLTGLPCAGCGMTRAVFFLLTGQFARSWRLNPMALPIVLLVIYCVIERYFLGRKIKGLKILVSILCVCMLAVYFYRMCTIFPNRPPYVYTAGNYLERQYPFYRELLQRLLGI